MNLAVRLRDFLLRFSLHRSWYRSLPLAADGLSVFLFVPLLCIGEVFRRVFAEIRSQELFRFGKRQMEITQTLHANSQILATAFKQMPPLVRSSERKWKWYPAMLKALENCGAQIPTRVPSTSLKSNSGWIAAALARGSPSSVAFIVTDHTIIIPGHGPVGNKASRNTTTCWIL